MRFEIFIRLWQSHQSHFFDTRSKRKMKNQYFFSCSLLAALLCLALAGCGDDANQMMKDSNATNIQRLANMYHFYQSRNNWLGPKSVEDFKEFVESAEPERLTRMGIDPSDIEGLFVSERDGKPFEFRFLVPGSPMGKRDPVVFEVEGVNGKRMVGFTSLNPMEAEDDAQYEAWKKGEFEDPFAGRNDSPPPQGQQ